jgi:hypothetical protein
MRHARATRRAGRLAIGLCVLSGLALPTVAQDIEQTEPDIATVIDALDDPRFAERERASVALEIRADELDALLGGELNLSELTLEQVERIGGALRSRFWATPRAALGVSFGRQLNAMAEGLPLQNVINGFPSATVLRGGDVVVSVDGIALVDAPSDMAQQMMRASILSRDPGDTLPMLVKRGNIELRVEAPLGAYRDLGPNAGVLTDAELERAWTVRSDRLGLSRYSGDVIESDLARRNWPQHRQTVETMSDTTAMGGGAGHSADFGELFAAAQGERITTVREEQLQQVRDDLESQLSMLNLQLEVVERQMTNPTATDAERRQAAMLHMQLQSKISEIQRQIDQINGRR